MAWLGLILAEVFAVVAAARGPAPPGADSCVVAVVGLPVPARAHHELLVSSGRSPIIDDKLVLSLARLSVTVSLVGPRYGGELPLDAGRCTGGRTHTLAARPLPAHIDFRAPRELAMRCDDGPPGFASKWWVARKLPPLDVGHGMTMTCEFKSPGFRPITQTLQLVPGDNAIDVDMPGLSQ